MARRIFILTIAVFAVLSVGTAQARVPAGFVGMTAEELVGKDTSQAYIDQALAGQRSAGVRLLRQTFRWNYIESAPSSLHPYPNYDWRLHDRLVLSAARHGITVMPVLFDTPDFYSGKRPGNPFTLPPLNPGTMAVFADAAVARYGPGGTLWRTNPGVPARPVKAWQVWNEPSLRPYWGGRPNAGQYVALLKAVNAAIKRRDRRAEVVTAGIPPSTLSGAVPIKKYVDQIYKAGGKSAFDTLAINSYARSAGELQRLLTGIRKIMNRRGDRRAKIWITELGWCDKGPRHRFCVGARKQATLISGSLKLIRAQRTKLGIRGFVYFSWRDGPPYAPAFKDLWGLHTGLLKLNGTPKSAFGAFKRGARPFR
jgi:hypothetical protein